MTKQNERKVQEINVNTKLNCQALLKAKYCPWPPYHAHTAHRNPCDLDL